MSSLARTPLAAAVPDGWRVSPDACARNADSGRAFHALKARLATWEAVRDAPVEQVQEAVSACTWPKQ